MKSFSILEFNQETGQTLQTYGGEGVSIVQKTGPHWDPRENTEKEGARLEIHLNVEDARELAKNLLASADFAEAFENNKPKTNRRY